MSGLGFIAQILMQALFGIIKSNCGCFLRGGAGGGGGGGVVGFMFLLLCVLHTVQDGVRFRGLGSARFSGFGCSYS